MIHADLLLTTGAALGEGPLWEPDSGDVIWVDIVAEQVLRTNLAVPDIRSSSIGEPVGALARTWGGGLIGATPTGLRKLDVPGAPVVAAFPELDNRLRSNDGKAAPDGRFVVGTMSRGTPLKGAGSLWSFGADSAIRLVRSTTISNGLAWSGDGTTLYFIDTPTQEVVAYEYDTTEGTIGGPRTVVKIDEASGAPDGMCIDAEGGLWVALWGGGAVHRYLEGRLDAVIDVPTPLVTCPAFVGDQLDLLVITTASVGADGEGREGAGDLYVAEPGVKGAPVPPLGSWAER